MSNLPCCDVILPVFVKGFVFLPGGLADGPCGYLGVWVLEGDLVILGLGFSESGCPFGGEAFCIMSVSFACINKQQYLTVP